MTLIRWQPFRDMERLLDEDMSSLFQARLPGDGAVDVYEQDEQVIVEMNAPGFSVEMFDVSVEGDHVRIAASCEDRREDKDKRYYSQEIRRGSFERIVRLPAAVVGDKASASYRNGVLRVAVPKQQDGASGKIKVEVARD